MKIQAKSFYSILAAVVITVLVALPSISNFKYNDHSKNWLNHDYGKNLLASTEEYSVFMTEGGDNQVFSSLYFTYAEKLRQDLFPYDQKGNIFKKIYGDLRYVTSDVLESRTETVDRGLFTGQEPFYTEIRSLNPPYLVPYALGKPATYLTWLRPNQSQLGDFYYKNYGNMNKVQDIKYAIVDYVEILQSANTSDIKNYVEEKLGRNIEEFELSSWIGELEDEELVKRNGNVVQFVKMYKQPFDKNPTETFIHRWDEIKNLRYYDYLSREIVISSSYEQLSVLSDKVFELQKALKVEDSEENRKAIQNDIDANWAKMQEYLDIISEVGFDSSATLHNVGIFYLSAQERFDFINEDLTIEAIPFWEQGVKTAPYAWSTYSILLWGYMRAILNNPAEADHYLEKFDKVEDALIKNIGHWKSMKKDIKKSQPYRQAQQMISMRDNIDQFVGPQIQALKSRVVGMIDNAETLNVSDIQQFVSAMVNQLSFIDNTPIAQEFFETWIALTEKYMSNKEFFTFQLGILAELSGYGEYVDKRLFKVTADKARQYLPSVSTATEDTLPVFMSAYRVAVASGDKAAISSYKNVLLQAAKKAVPANHYSAIVEQVNQIR